MALKSLIDNQTIIIDDHNRGNREIKNWDNNAADVHIDKTTNYPVNGKRQNIRIKVPINSDRPIKIENAKKKVLDEIPRQLRREIQDAFEDKQTRDRFIRDVVDSIRNFDTILENEQRVRVVLSRLSEHFDLRWTKEKIATYTNDALSFYTQNYTDNTGRKYFISVDRDRIKIGESNGYAKHQHQQEIKRK